MTDFMDAPMATLTYNAPPWAEPAYSAVPHFCCGKPVFTKNITEKFVIMTIVLLKPH